MVWVTSCRIPADNVTQCDESREAWVAGPAARRPYPLFDEVKQTENLCFGDHEGSQTRPSSRSLPLRHCHWVTFLFVHVRKTGMHVRTALASITRQYDATPMSSDHTLLPIHNRFESLTMEFLDGLRHPAPQMICQRRGPKLLLKNNLFGQHWQVEQKEIFCLDFIPCDLIAPFLFGLVLVYSKTGKSSDQFYMLFLLVRPKSASVAGMLGSLEILSLHNVWLKQKRLTGFQQTPLDGFYWLGIICLHNLWSRTQTDGVDQDANRQCLPNLPSLVQGRRQSIRVSAVISAMHQWRLKNEGAFAIRFMILLRSLADTTSSPPIKATRHLRHLNPAYGPLGDVTFVDLVATSSSSSTFGITWPSTKIHYFVFLCIFKIELAAMMLVESRPVGNHVWTRISTVEPGPGAWTE
ncbi:hypothetical protein C8J56DRAFT_1032033 [Mycena floridula]|nr:hypothetical protein C8J56DRAFT_1032033 [Mycena floridula]